MAVTLQQTFSLHFDETLDRLFSKKMLTAYDALFVEHNRDFFTGKKVSAPVISVGETNLKRFAYERITRLPRVGSCHLKKL